MAQDLKEKKCVQLSWQLPTFPCLFKVSSVQSHLTSGFGMGPGGSTTLSHHYNYSHFFFAVIFCATPIFFPSRSWGSTICTTHCDSRHKNMCVSSKITAN